MASWSMGLGIARPLKDKSKERPFIRPSTPIQVPIISSEASLDPGGFDSDDESSQNSRSFTGSVGSSRTVLPPPSPSQDSTYGRSSPNRQDTAASEHVIDTGRPDNSRPREPRHRRNSSMVPLLGDRHIEKSDSHFRMLYEYHQRFGFKCIVLHEAFALLTTLFGVLLSGFLVSCVDWQVIFKHEKYSLWDSLYESCAPRGLFLRLAYVVFFGGFLFQMGYAISLWSHVSEIADTWQKVLLLPDDVKWVQWTDVTQSYGNKDPLVGSYGDHVDDYIVGKIMRYDNYLIAMLNCNVLGFDSSRIFTKWIGYTLYGAFRMAFFSVDHGLPQEFLSDINDTVYTRRLRYAFFTCGVVTALLSPFLFFASVVYFLYRHLSIYHKDPTKIGLYQFTPLARWKLRDFNELPHVFFERLERAHEDVQRYLSEFADERLNAPMRFLEFASGAILAVLVAVSLLDQSLLVSFQIVQGKPILFVMGICGAIFMYCQSAIKRDHFVPDPERRFDDIVRVLHYTPMSWNSLGLSYKAKYNEIRSLFRFRVTVFLHEIFSIVYCPLIFLFWLPKRSGSIVRFLRENSTFVEGRGVLCSYSILGDGQDDILDDSLHGFGESGGHEECNSGMASVLIDPASGRASPMMARGYRQPEQRVSRHNITESAVVRDPLESSLERSMSLKYSHSVRNFQTFLAKTRPR